MDTGEIILCPTKMCDLIRPILIIRGFKKPYCETVGPQ